MPINSVLPGGTLSVKTQDDGALITSASNLAKFPDGFCWGLATASYQIEGSPKVDGKGMSIWDTYAHIPGKMKNNDTGDVAIDHYQRYKEDVQIMKEMGATGYRFSIAWSRIFPSGTGLANPKGLDFYNRLVDELLNAGIQPFATLYHWDLPQALQDKGGWQSRETAECFAQYAGYMAEKLSDRVKNFFTLNEFQNIVDMGHRGVDMVVQGKPVHIELAPGLKLDNQALNQVAHHTVLAHGLSVQAIRAMGKKGTKVGPAEVMFCGVPIMDSPEHVKAAELATRRLNARFLDVMLTGKYSDAYLQEAGKDAPKFTEEDLQAIGSPVDFVGINVYIPKMYVMASEDESGYKEVPMSVSHPKMSSPWHTFAPEVLYWAPRLTHSIWKPKAIYITENGCAASDEISADGNIYDTDRVMYLRNAMGQLQRASAEGVPIKGNFVWSAFDNLEWSGGFGTRFGLVHVNFKTQKRTPKLSAKWFKEAAGHNAVL
ncbi:GH1 family beta-glucosidase [Desulfotalea psychrophila]|uniref:Beta-glucosidase n=1 Tax=Desulfotalea psychrophila (strain LSv54 / DSM 12343) TaxID=177439 RepID=Q6AKE8_DESPS|nr:GH1 family beta-glucosidase [Desulfotalea psychrophila]CAG37177.1 probable beta-glucosidase A (BglA) [Desulfotalea psychrophila LSv54]